MLANLIGGFIIITIGVNLMPTIADAVYEAQFYGNGTAGYVFSTNVTGAASTILGLTTIFFSLGVMASGVSLAIAGLRNAGMM